MGQLIDGKWQTHPTQGGSGDGRFHRAETQFRNWITADGSPGPAGEGGFQAEPGRYHLYISLACPWAHRTMVVRKLKGLDDHIGASSVAALMLEGGWVFTDAFPDPVLGKKHAYEIYQEADAGYTGRASVPILWDKQRGTIVSNESADIIRMLNAAFDDIGADAGIDLYPEPLRDEIDRINAVVYDTVNNGVYKSGFATTQAAYEDAVSALFATLDELEDRLSRQRYLVGHQPTEADWRLFTTLVRFDAVYVGHFKCNIRRIADYPNLSGYLRELYQVPGIAGTVDIGYIKQHYYGSHLSVNPTGIVPVGPILDLESPHGRDRLKAA